MTSIRKVYSRDECTFIYVDAVYDIHKHIYKDLYGRGKAGPAEAQDPEWGGGRSPVGLAVETTAKPAEDGGAFPAPQFCFKNCTRTCIFIKLFMDPQALSACPQSCSV